MRTHTALSRILTDQRGIALPMALMIVLILSALMAAFAVLGASEPTLAANQQRVAQARAMAESGLGRAIWALNNPTDASGIPIPLVTPAAPYDGITAVPVSLNGVQIGVFTVSVTNGTLPNERNIVATGWSPTNAGTGPKAKQTIKVTVFQIFLNPPSALTVRGEIKASGSALIDSRADFALPPTSCGAKAGTYSKGATTAAGAAAIYGADGNNVKNQVGDMTQNVADAAFNPYTYSNVELNALKALAKKNGTYHQGTVSFSSSNQMPNGIVYVDTVSGNNIDAGGANTTPTSDFASVSISGGAPLDASGIFSGMLIVAGSLSISGSFQMKGTVYVLNDLTYLGTGQITGSVISQNIRDVSSTTIDTDLGGNPTIIWNCHDAKTGGDQVPQTFAIEPGTYKEVPG